MNILNRRMPLLPQTRAKKARTNMQNMFVLQSAKGCQKNGSTLVKSCLQMKNLGDHSTRRNSDITIKYLNNYRLQHNKYCVRTK